MPRKKQNPRSIEETSLVPQEIADTPMMQQFFLIKKKYPDAILLFRVGDFYETFLEDAVATSNILGITLTRRANGSAQSIELAGFPHHALDVYLPRLVKSGRRVAICDQLEDPKKTKKLVRRGVTELVTPGVVASEGILDNKENNFLMALFRKNNLFGIALLDYSTGEFLTTQGDEEVVRNILSGYSPREILLERKDRPMIESILRSDTFIFDSDDWIFSETNNKERVERHFSVTNLKGYGVEKLPLAVVACGAVLNYLDLTEHKALSHISSLTRIDHSQYMRIDDFTLRNLEMLRSYNDNGKCLLDILDETITPMGARRLKQWIAYPSKDLEEICARQDGVEDLCSMPELREVLQDSLREIGDLERLVSRISMRRASPRDLLRLLSALRAIEPIQQEAARFPLKEVLRDMIASLSSCTGVAERIAREIHPEASISLSKGHAIAQGYCSELDELREIAYHGQDFLLKMQQREIEATGIASLKIGFNNVFGYYIEVRNTHKDLVPKEWIRKQTLVNAERYITEELKAYEEKILTAQEKISALESHLFFELIEDLQAVVPSLQRNCALIARIDTLFSLATVADRYRYVRPQVDSGYTIAIEGGRHPVIERMLPKPEDYVPNDIYLDQETCQIMIITGPNMSGKSALLRQTALVVIMAQMGSFVPAQSAHVGMVDAVFTRVGASDNLSQGESTFMVEMQEAANILNSLSHRSLVLFDELGRGTSTFDGISIAWSIVEYIHNRPDLRAKTLFATHYHELNELETLLPRVRNYNVSAEEVHGKMLFLRKLIEGGSEHSFGIQVARLAGMPRWIVQRAEEVLLQLESSRSKEAEVLTDNEGCCSTKEKEKKKNISTEYTALSLYRMDDPILLEIQEKMNSLDLDRLTPIEALNYLSEIKEILKKT